MSLPNRRVLSAADLEGMADVFRETYAPECSGVLDIEEIVEHDLGITLIPLQSLAFRTRRKAWLSCTGDRIVVDEGVMMSSWEEYRFLIAEEAGHAVLHKYLLPVRAFADDAEFRRFHRGINKETERWVEWQARTWAGRVLVPRRELAHVFTQTVTAARRLFRSFSLSEAGILYVEEEIGAYFGVTPFCAHVRIDQDGLWSEAVRDRGLRLIS
ncbi:ImmA/IrrE family metallo-endopeptidase [Longimicrobium terrae]|uniref:IrrE N-terminal-like domain-containing protein n=1 Tax=Longimicrobium terrae TaxID=1639882 RepID=A0A841H3N8_9BACT|nr:ImmA/IrrE family metallo-endopeptidase [Longimicrobium terrae]MBB4638344.1 hypothetical protein [Longimicrobium terrae]MBB6072588.1 hypothetical protein [Longimicrobium terrae]NNC28633.1 ImmA/IrrE family metallo-endopeptidase [Longimicrobium terrae]